VKGRTEPIAGYVERSDSQEVVVREVLPDGSRQEHRLTADEVEDIVETVSNDRLAGLRPERPGEYRDYAEELAEKRRDPEARETSLRLYVIAAWLDPKKLGRSCLLGMAVLARTVDEAQAYRALAYLLDPRHDPRSLKMKAPQSDAAGRELQQGEQALLRAIRFLRRGDGRRARMQAELPETEAAFRRWAKIVSAEEFVKATRGELSNQMLGKLLELELRLQHNAVPASSDRTGTADVSWSQLVERHGSQPVRPLALETITPWDPAECVFRNGRWVRPAPDP
jgi:hypothetical protein